MTPDAYLQFAGKVLTYSLQLSVGVVACMAVNRLCMAAHRRFRLWLGFMIASVVYGLVLIAQELQEVRHGQTTDPVSQPPHPWFILPAHFWQVPQQWRTTLTSWLPLVGVFYLAVAASMLMTVIWRQVKLRLLVRQSMPPEPELAALFDGIRARAGADRCELVVVPGLASPATAFWWRPRILLPEFCEEMDGGDSLATVLWHELVHVRRRDYFWALAVDIACCILFFHPAVWKARRQMRIERELACDEAVIAAYPDGRADYAESLTRFARLLMIEEGVNAGIDFAAPVNFLSTRVRAILADRRRAPMWQRAVRGMGSVALLGIFCVLAPGLVVFLRFGATGLPASSGPAVARVPAFERGTAPRGTAPGAHATPVKATIIETPATRMAPRWRGGDIPASADSGTLGVEEPAERFTTMTGDAEWREQTPGRNGRVRTTTVQSVLLQTAGLILEEGREGHTVHPTRKRISGR